LSAIINCFVASADEHTFLNDHEATHFCGTAEAFLVWDSWLAGEPIPFFDNNIKTRICDAVFEAIYKELTNQFINRTIMVFICPPN